MKTVSPIATQLAGVAQPKPPIFGCGPLPEPTWSSDQLAQFDGGRGDVAAVAAGDADALGGAGDGEERRAGRRRAAADPLTRPLDQLGVGGGRTWPLKPTAVHELALEQAIPLSGSDGSASEAVQVQAISPPEVERSPR